MSGFRNIVIENPCKLQYKGGYMVVRREDDTTKIHLSEISSVVLQTNQVFVSAYLLSELAKAKVTFVVSDEKYDPIGQYLPLYGAHNTSKRITEQMEWGEPIKNVCGSALCGTRLNINPMSCMLVHAKNKEKHLKVSLPRCGRGIQQIEKVMRHGCILTRCLALGFRATATHLLTQLSIMDMQFCCRV